MSYYDFKRKQMIETLAGDSLTTVEGVPPLSLPQSKGMDLDQYKIYGDSVQMNIPSAYQEYTSVEDTNGNIYTALNGIYPAKRISDNVFGLYNTNTNAFQTEV